MKMDTTSHFVFLEASTRYSFVGQDSIATIVMMGSHKMMEVGKGKEKGGA